MTGPLRILIAISAPLAGGGQVLDYERELRNVIAVVRGARQSHAQVRVVHFATTAEINAALRHEPMHVLHLSGHGAPGLLGAGGRGRQRTETAVTDVYATRAFTRIYGSLADDEALDVLSAVADAARTDLLERVMTTPDSAVAARVEHAIALFRGRDATKHNKRSAAITLASILEECRALIRTEIGRKDEGAHRSRAR